VTPSSFAGTLVDVACGSCDDQNRGAGDWKISHFAKESNTNTHRFPDRSACLCKKMFLPEHTSPHPQDAANDYQ